MYKILTVQAKEIMDSRGNPTITASCELEGGFLGQASVPSGKSTGVHEALELRDGDKSRYDGRGVEKAINNINSDINNLLHGKAFTQSTLDDAMNTLDGTANKSRLGSNAILGVSLAFARAYANAEGKELFQYIGSLAQNTKFSLPTPMLNIINGGQHSSNNLDFQEFMIIPSGFNSFEDKIKTSEKVFSSLQKILKDNNYGTNKGDEGGYAPNLSGTEQALGLLSQAITDSGFDFNQVQIGLDVAASNLYTNNNYHLKTNGGEINKTSTEMVEYYQELTSRYPIMSIEDGLAEDDWAGFKELTSRLGDKVNIVGDDLTVTNIQRINTAMEMKAINSVLVKLNQIGTLTETIEAVLLTKKNNWAPIISHRSGETTDTFIADLAVGLDCPFIKAGAPGQIERKCKYDRLVEIERMLKGL